MPTTTLEQQTSPQEISTGAWTLHPSVALRPEPFGALAYHFGTRRLSFLKTPELVDVVRRLAASPDVGTALREAGVAAADHPAYLVALRSLATGGMITPRDTEGDPA